jgi:hypothetical protein
MSKLFFLLFILILAKACNSNSPKVDTSNTGAVKQDSIATKYTWTSDEEKQYLADCVNNAKPRLSDTAAYAYCKCVLEQLKQKFPTADSASAVLDSTMAAQLAANCK